jgi:hypothetical protein
MSEIRPNYFKNAYGIGFRDHDSNLPMRPALRSSLPSRRITALAVMALSLRGFPYTAHQIPEFSDDRISNVFSATLGVTAEVVFQLR